VLDAEEGLLFNVFSLQVLGIVKWGNVKEVF